MSLVPDHFESLKRVIVIRRDPAFSSCDIYLIFNGVHTFKIREQEPALRPVEIFSRTPYRTEAQAFIRETLGWKWMTTYGTHTGTAVPVGEKPLSLNISPTWKTMPNPDCYSVENADGIVPAALCL